MSCSDDAQACKTTLGGADRRKLDEYLFAIRDIEKRIQQAEREQRASVAVPVDARRRRASRPTSPSTPPDDGPAGAGVPDRQTRVITVLMGIEQSPRNYPEIGITEGHHGLTHHQGDKEKIEKVAQINEYHIKQFAYLLDKLKATTDGDGTLLDHSMIVYGSALADGNRAPAHHNLPTVLAGRGNGTLHAGTPRPLSGRDADHESVSVDARPMGVPVERSATARAARGSVGPLKDGRR